MASSGLTKIRSRATKIVALTKLRSHEVFIENYL